MNALFVDFRKLLVGIGIAVAFATIASAEDFYTGKTVRITVGSSPGGGFDFYARAVARHLGKHIPGSPSVIVVNMPGAGGLVAANYAYNVAKPDGLSVWLLNNNFIQLAALGDKSVKLDGPKFGWVGSTATTTYTCAIMGFTGFETFDEMRKSGKKVVMGGLAEGTQTVVQPKLLNMFLGTNFQVVAGYRGGTSALRAAMQRREVDGACWGWQSMKATASDMLHAQGDERLIPFLMDRRMMDEEVRNVPVISDLIKDETNLSTYLVWSLPSRFFRSFAVSPGTPEERLDLLRDAFKSTLEDPNFLADAEKSKLEIEYTSGEEVEQLVERISNMPNEARKTLEPLMMKGKKGN